MTVARNGPTQLQVQHLLVVVVAVGVVETVEVAAGCLWTGMQLSWCSDIVAGLLLLRHTSTSTGSILSSSSGGGAEGREGECGMKSKLLYGGACWKRLNRLGSNSDLAFCI